MGDMFEAFSGGKCSTPMSISRGDFKRNLDGFAASVAEGFLRMGKDMDESIAKIAEVNNLNDDQIQRVIEESNNKVYLSKYAQMKNENERDVKFTVAKMDNIKSKMLGNQDMIKSASENKERIDSFNCYNPYRTGSMGYEAEPDLAKMIAEKLAGDLSVANSNAKKAEKKLDSQIFKIAEMLIRYDRAGADIQDNYKTICKEAGLMAPEQKVLSMAINELIEQEKLAGTVNNNYELKLDYVDLTESEPDYSIGLFSHINKQAGYFPVMQIGDTVVKSVSDMVKMAQEIKPLIQDVDETKRFLKEAEEKSTFEKEE